MSFSPLTQKSSTLSWSNLAIFIASSRVGLYLSFSMAQWSVCLHLCFYIFLLSQSCVAFLAVYYFSYTITLSLKNKRQQPIILITVTTARMTLNKFIWFFILFITSNHIAFHCGLSKSCTLTDKSKIKQGSISLPPTTSA